MNKGRKGQIDVLVIGRSCVDIIAIIDRFPEEDTKVPLYERIIEGGGQGGTAACCISRLGGKVAYWGKVGDDKEGYFCLKRLRDFEVDTSLVEVIPGGRTPTAYIFITRASGKRTIFYEKNNLPPLELTRLKELLSSPPSVVLLDPETTYLIGEVKDYVGSKTKIVYDGERWHPSVEEAMNWADFFIPSADFFPPEARGDRCTFFREIISLSSKISGQLVVTWGKEGAFFVADGILFQVPAPMVDVKDTTGAGDNFHAAFSLAVSRGFTLPEATKFSVAVASLSCRALGGRAGIPSLREAQLLAQSLKVVECPG
ncbi:MAG: carbohydrate kinase family protein [Syntrophales bacterium]|nr:carbohydrate kinase family protein [Syntrophales bacterium]